LENNNESYKFIEDAIAACGVNVSCKLALISVE
jgi:hypothetical protein